jgi:ABC-2 type transport system permease protein
MRTFFVLLERELKSYFYSPIAYIVLCFVLALAGFNAYTVVSVLNRGPSDYTMVEVFFNTAIFWFAFLPIIPLITMRLYSEEFKLGTIETLMTAPVNEWQVVASKFAGALFFYLVLWLPTMLYFVLFQSITKQPAAPSAGAYFGSYLLMLLIGMFYLSLGCFASVLTRNQIIAAVISFVLVLLTFFTGLLGFVMPNASQPFRDLVSYFSWTAGRSSST